MRPTRWRWVSRAGLCLVLGLVTTVAVAWALAAWLPHRGLVGRSESVLAWSPRQVHEFSRTGMARRSWSFGKLRDARDYMSSPVLLRPERALLASPPFARINAAPVPWGTLRRDWGALGEAERSGDPPPQRWGIEDARGWPALALWCSIRVRDPVAFTLRAAALPGGEVGMVAAGCSGGVQISEPGSHVGAFRALPLRPIWRGLLINTSVYALAWGGLLLGPGWARRSRRRRRGLCVACGYELRGLASGTDCPECGTAAGAPA